MPPVLDRVSTPRRSMHGYRLSGPGGRERDNPPGSHCIRRRRAAQHRWACGAHHWAFWPGPESRAHGVVHGGPGLQHRERCAAFDPLSPGIRGRFCAMGGDGLRHHVRRPLGAGGPDRRHLRPALHRSSSGWRSSPPHRWALASPTMRSFWSRPVPFRASEPRSWRRRRCHSSRPALPRGLAARRPSGSTAPPPRSATSSGRSSVACSCSTRVGAPSSWSTSRSAWRRLCLPLVSSSLGQDGGPGPPASMCAVGFSSRSPWPLSSSAISEGPVLGWLQPAVIGAGVIAALALVRVLWSSSGHKSIPSSISGCSGRPGLRTAAILTLLVGAWTAGELVVMSVYLQQALHDSPLVAGLVIAPQGVAGFVTGMFGARLVRRLGMRTMLVVATAAAGLGFLVLSDLPTPRPLRRAVRGRRPHRFRHRRHRLRDDRHGGQRHGAGRPGSRGRCREHDPAGRGRRRRGGSRWPLPRAPMHAPGSPPSVEIGRPCW